MSASFTIGVAGHVDHGKTTLVRSLTGIDTDRKVEEKVRGLSIESGVAELKLPDGRSVALLDVPGHTDFLKNTVRGLNSVDMALLVVAADDGVMPQTREHLDILSFFNASSGLVVLSKTDLVDEETVELAEMELGELLSGTFLDRCPILRYSHRNPGLCTGIIRYIEQVLNGIPAKPPGGSFRLWIDQVKSIKGHGTVVSGTIASGTVHVGDALELLPCGMMTRARSLQKHGRSVEQAVAGERVGINLHRVPLRDVRRGMMLAASGAIPAGYLLNTEITVLTGTRKGIKNHQRVKFYLGTSITNALVVLMDSDRIDPGGTGLAQVRLMHPVAALPRDRFVISPLNINTVIAGGRVLETAHEKFRAVKTEVLLPPLKALQTENIDTYVERLFNASQDKLITARALAGKTGLPAERFERCINAKVQKGEWVYFKGYGAIAAHHLSDLKTACRTIIEDAFRDNPLRKNIALSAVAKLIGRPVEAPLLKIVADLLCKAGRIAPYEGGYILRGAAPALDERREALGDLLVAYARENGLTPFSADTFWKLNRPVYDKAEIRQVLNYLSTRKRLVRLNDQRFLSLEAIEKIKTRVARAIERNGFVTVGDCKTVFGYGRWGGTHVLDYLNAIGFTIRREDKHYLAKETW
jgi:selenocysteine-specific elongation factor